MRISLHDGFSNPWKKFLTLVMLLAVFACCLQASGASLWPPQNIIWSELWDADKTDPVDANAGGYYFDLPLLELGGPMDLKFHLNYRSSRGTALPLGDLPGWGKWEYDARRMLSVSTMSGKSYYQFELGDGDEVAFLKNPDNTFSLLNTNSFGLPGSGSPVNYQLKGDTNWLYLLDPKTGHVQMFQRYTNNNWRIATIIDRNGNQVAYEYNPAVGMQRPVGIEDGDGRRLDLQYGPMGITNVTDHAGRVVRLINEEAAPDNASNDCLRFVVDATGRTNRFDYTWAMDQWGGREVDLVAAHTQPGGNVPWRQAYTTAWLYAEDSYDLACVASQADAYSNQVHFLYDTNAHALSVVWPDGTTNRYANSARHRPPEAVTDAEGGQTLLVVDDRNRIAGMTDPAGQSVGFEYDETNALLTALTNSADKVLRFEYSATEQIITNPAASGETVTFTFHELASIHYPDGSSEAFFYDGRGNVTSLVDRAGQATACAYDGRGNLVRRTAPGGGTDVFEYDAWSRMVSSVDADGVTNRFEYDALDRVTNIVDGAGLATSFEYDAAGRLLRMVYPDGLETLFAYDANGNRLKTTDRDGAVNTVSYDLMNRAALTTNALGGVTRDDYDVVGYLAETVGPDGITNQFQRDALGRVTNEMRGGVSVAATYDAEGRLVSRTSGRGYVESLGYDVDGRFVASTNALSYVMRFDRDADGRVTNIVDELGHVTAYAYEDGQLVARTDAEGRTTHLAYDANGRAAVATAPDGAQTTFAYTPAGRLAAVTNPLGHATTYEYDAAGRLARSSDSLGRNTVYEYDEMGRITRLTDPASNKWESVVHDDIRTSLAANPLGGLQTTVFLPGGYPAMYFDSETDPWTYQWDSSGRLVETTDPMSNTMAFAYDDFGRVAAITNPLGHAVAFEYDADGNLVRSVDELGAETRRGYDALGQVTSVVGRTGGKITFAYDAAGRIIRREDADGIAVETDYDATGLPLVRRTGAETWTNTYDAAGRLATVASPLGHVQVLRRDALGLVTNVVDAAGGVTAYEYDAAERLVAQTDPEDRATHYEYDTIDGLVRVTLNDGAYAAYERDALGNVTRITDLGGNEWTRAWTPMGRWLNDIDPLGRTNACERDTIGRVARWLRADGSTVDIQYDAAGQVTGRVYSAGLALAFEYDAAKRLVQATSSLVPQPSTFSYDAAGRVTNALLNGQAYAATWTPGGRLASVSYADHALTINYAYDPVSGRLDTVTDSLTGTQIAFAYDADGRLVQQTDSHGGTNAFTYDAAGRVTRIQATPGMDLQYTYDAAGRLVSEIRDVPKPAGEWLTACADTNQYDAASQLATPGTAYDSLGCRTADSRYQYQWSPDKRLTNITDSSFIIQPSSFAYDALGNIIARNSQPLACHPAIARTPLVDDGTNWYVWMPGGALLFAIAQAPGHAVHHYRFDSAGHTIALVDTNGAVAEAYAYTPGGLELDPAPSAIGNPFRFLGRHGIRAEGSGDLYHVRARWYDARTRAFLSKEPLWPRTDDPHALNPYQYANADPVNFADVDGLLSAGMDDLHALYGFVDHRMESVAVVVPEDEQEAFKEFDSVLEKLRSRLEVLKRGVQAGEETSVRFVRAHHAHEEVKAWVAGLDYDFPEQMAKRLRKRQQELKRAEFNRLFGPVQRNADGTIVTHKYQDAEIEEMLLDLQQKALVDVRKRRAEWNKKEAEKKPPAGGDIPGKSPSKDPFRLAPPEPDKDMAGVDPTGVQYDWWHQHSGSREDRLMEIVTGGGNAPQKKAAAAVATHLGNGDKRHMLADKMDANPDKDHDKKKEIKLSGDWEGEDGTLDIKPFHLGK
jgi:RHS repeat-associated protein